MVRWSIIGFGATIAVLVVIVIILNRSNRNSQSTQTDADTTAMESAAPTPVKPMPEEPAHPAALTDPVQKAPSRVQVSESDRSSIKPPVAQGPLKLLKGLYQDESHDPIDESTERLIRAQFDPKIFPVELLHTVICHKSVCKIAVFWSNKQPMVLAGVMVNLHPILSVHFALEPVSEPDDKGDVLIDMYILRKGFELEDLQ